VTFHRMVPRLHQRKLRAQMSAQQTWWIDQPFVLASCNPGNEELGQLRLQGFRVVASLLEEDKQPARYAKKSAAVAGWATYSMPIVAGGAPSIDRLGAMMVRLKAYAKGTKILIHCESGTGRAALIGAAYWIGKGLTMGEAMARIAQAGVEPGWATEERKQLLRQWRSAHGTLVQGSPRRALRKQS